MELVYLNNAATSWPKPASVIEAVRHGLEAPPLEPGRSHGSSDPRAECRHELALLLAVPREEQVILTPSATHSINMVIEGMLLERPGGRVVTTDLEHNSVLRPTMHRVRAGRAEASLIGPDGSGAVTPGAVAEALTTPACLVAITHASNVTGCVLNAEGIAEVCAARGVPLLLDMAQTAGSVPLDYGRLPGRVFVALAGHKGLMGPTGIGALIVPDAELPQTIVGGTGVRSDLELHPPELPIRYETGTPNWPGIAGLTAGVRWVREQGVAELGARRHALVSAFREALAGVPGVWLPPLARHDGRAGVACVAVADWSGDELSHALYASFGVVTRGGLHCAPRALRGAAEAADGTLRVSFGPCSTEDDALRAARALRSLAEA